MSVCVNDAAEVEVRKMARYSSVIASTSTLGGEERRAIREVIAQVESEDPIAVRIENFWAGNLALLESIDPKRIIFWRIEFMGSGQRFDELLRSGGVDANKYTEEILGTGRKIIPYTFSSWNRHFLTELIPSLGCKVEVIPVAQKYAKQSLYGMERVRDQYQIPREALVFGVGGSLSHWKGLEDIVQSFIWTCTQPKTYLFCSVLEEDAEDPQSLIRSWSRRFPGTGLDRVRVRIGRRGEWSKMCAFYRALDCVLVNSLADSWGRMASEPFGLGVPVLIRRATCATNHLIDDGVLVDSFDDFNCKEFRSALQRAKVRAPSIAETSKRMFSAPTVRQKVFRLIREVCDSEQLSRLESLMLSGEQIQAVDKHFSR